MDISKQINKECDEAKAMLMEALSQKKAGVRIRQAATKTPDKTNARDPRRVPIMKASDKDGPTASMGTLYQSWNSSFRNKMMFDARQRLSPKDRSRLNTSEEIQMMMNSKEFK